MMLHVQKYILIVSASILIIFLWENGQALMTILLTYKVKYANEWSLSHHLTLINEMCP